MASKTKRRDWSDILELIDPLECWHVAPVCADKADSVHGWCLNCIARNALERLIEIDGEPVEPITIKPGDVMEAGKTYRLESGRVTIAREEAEDK